MNLEKVSKWLMGIGGFLFILSLLFEVFKNYLWGFRGLFNPFFDILPFWWIFLISGIALLIISRGSSISGLANIKKLTFKRHDIIKSTNWVRVGGIDSKRQIGKILMACGIVLTIIEFLTTLIFNSTPALFYIWIFFFLGGAVLLIWRPLSVVHDYSKKVFIKLPNFLSINTFHTYLRQQIEDAGYVISENVSPGEGSSVSKFNNIFLLNGGIKARKEVYSLSKLLIPRLSKIPILSDIFTILGCGVFLIFLGPIFILTLNSQRLVSGELLFIAALEIIMGIILLIYDIVTRSKKLAEIYVIEEGTVFNSSINTYDSRILEKQGFRAEPNISGSHTSCELLISVGATRNRFFDAVQLEKDFNSIVESIENIKKETILNAREGTII